MSDLSDLLAEPGAAIEGENDFEAVNALYLDRGWSDGLPIVPPTAERVEAMLVYCDRPLDKPIGAVAPRYGEATPVRLAANAVMAGCRPEYFPVLMFAIEAMCEEPTFGATKSVTRALKRADGSLAKSVNDFRRS